MFAFLLVTPLRVKFAIFIHVSIIKVGLVLVHNLLEGEVLALYFPPI